MHKLIAADAATTTTKNTPTENNKKLKLYSQS